METKVPSKQWMHTHLENKPKTFTQILSSCQKYDVISCLEQERSAAGGIHATKDDSSFRHVYRSTKINA
jgi:hypothetical protein